eukprot:s2201_g11.t2
MYPHRPAVMGPMCLQPATNTVLGCSRPLLVSPVKVLDKHIQQDEALVRPPPSRPPSLPQRPSGKCLQHSSSACDLSILPKAGRAKQESLREAFRTPTTTASSCSQCSWSSPEAAAKPDLAAAAYELVPERLERMKLFKELVHAVAAPQPQAPAPASEAQRRRAKRRLQVPPKSMQRCGDLSEEEKEKEKEVAELLERLEKQLAEERDDSLCPFLCGVWQNDECILLVLHASGDRVSSLRSARQPWRNNALAIWIWLSIGCLHLWRSWLPQSCLHLGRKHLPMLNTCVGVRESLGTSSFGLACVLFTISLYEHCDPKCLKACSWRWSQGQQWQTWLARTSTGPAAACFLRIAGSLRRIRRRHHRTIRNVPKQGLINAVKEATDKSEARLHDLSLLGGMSASANRIPRRMRPRRDIGF